MTFEEYWFIVAEKTGKTVTKEQLKYYCEIAYGQGQASIISGNDFNIFKEAVKEFDGLNKRSDEEQRLINADALKKVIEEIYFSDKWFDFRVNYGSNGVRDVILDLVTYTPAVAIERPMGEWIPVGEGYPEEETDVLICNVDGDIIISRGSFSTEIKDKFIWYTSGCG